MNAKELIEIIKANPWQTMGQLVKLATPNVGKGIKEPDVFIKALVKEIRDQLQTWGQKRGTRYALIGAPEYVEPTIDEETISSVLAAVVAGKSTSGAIELHTKIAVATVRESLRILIEREQVERTGGTRSTQYWPAGQAPSDQPKSGEPSKTISPSPTAKLKPPPKAGTKAHKAGVARTRREQPATPEIEAVTPVPAQAEPEPVKAAILTSREAIDRAIAELPIGVKITPGDLSFQAVNKYCDANGFLGASSYIYQLIKIKDARIFASWENRDGRRIMIWRPRPGEIRPTDTSNVVSFIEGKPEREAREDASE